MSRIAPPPFAAVFAQIKRIGPLGLIILVHVMFFYALQSGLLRKASQAVPPEIIATFITPDPVRETPRPQPQPAAPKTVPVVKKAVTPRTPPTPVVNTTPSPNAISTPVSTPAPEPAAPTAAPVAAPPAPPVQPKTITSGVEYIQPPRPDYPPVAKRMGEEGKTVLRVLINDKGRAERVEVQKSSGSPRLDEAARQAALRALFKPYTEDGKPVAVYAIIPITFQLD